MHVCNYTSTHVCSCLDIQAHAFLDVFESSNTGVNACSVYMRIDMCSLWWVSVPPRFPHPRPRPAWVRSLPVGASSTLGRRSCAGRASPGPARTMPSNMGASPVGPRRKRRARPRLGLRRNGFGKVALESSAKARGPTPRMFTCAFCFGFFPG